MPREDDMLAAMMGGFQEQAVRVDSMAKKKPLGGSSDDDFKDLLAGTWSEHGLPPLDPPKEKKEAPRVMQLGEIAAMTAGESVSNSSSPIPLSSSPQSSNAHSEQKQVQQQQTVPPPNSPFSDLFDVLRTHTDSAAAVASLKSVLSTGVPSHGQSPSQSNSLNDIATELYNSCKQSSSGTSRDRCDTIEFVKKHYRKMHLVPKVVPLTQPIPTDPMEEVIAPDGYNYISNMPSSAARNTLQYMFSDEAAGMDENVRVMLQNWEKKLRSNIHAAPTLPGDDVCESPATATINFDSEKLVAAKQQCASAKQRRDQLVAGVGSDSGGIQSEWSAQEILAEEWRMREAENTINELTEKVKTAPALSLPESNPSSHTNIDTTISPQALSVSGSVHDLDGIYSIRNNSPTGQILYSRVDSKIKLFSDGSKWGFIDQNAGTSSSPYAISTKNESRNPLSIETWYEIDEEKGKYTANTGIKIEETTKPMDDGMAMLLGMGFGEEAIRTVWELTGGSVEQSIDILTTQEQNETVEENPLQVPQQAAATTTKTKISPPQSELTRESSLGSLREMFGTLDAAIVDDVVKQYGLANEEECVLALSEMSVTPQNSSSNLRNVPQHYSQPQLLNPPPTQVSHPVTPPVQRRQFRVLPEKGIALRTKQDYSAIETKMAGPLRGEILSARTVEPNWIRLEYGYWLPRYKEHKMLLEEVDTTESNFKNANSLGAELGDDNGELLHAIETGRVKLLQLLLHYRSKPITPDLVEAVAKNDKFKQKDELVQSVRKLFLSKTSLNDVGNDGMTPLMRSCKNLHLLMAKELLESGADPNIMSSHGSSALSLLFAAMKRSTIIPHQELEIPFEDVNLLTSQLATPTTLNTIPDAGEHRGMTILHSSLRENKKGRASLLLSLGADKTIKDSLGYTPLHAALTVPKFEDHPNAARVLEELIDATTINEPNKEGSTPLFAAIQTKSRFIDMLLDSGANPAIRNSSGATPVMYATAPEFITRLDLYKRLVIPEAVQGLPLMTSPLHYAMEPNKIEMANILLDAGADPKHLDNRHQCALHYAVLQECETDEWLELVNRLMKDPSILALQNGDGVSPLHAAARSGRKRVISALIQRGASLTLQAAGGNTPLHFAASVSSYNNPEMRDVINLLVDIRGGSGVVDSQDQSGMTALHLAARSSFWILANHLLEAGAKSDISDLSGKLPYHHIVDQSACIITAFDRSVIQRLQPTMHFECAVPPLPQSPI